MPDIEYSEVILLIAIGQLTMLALGALRRQENPYARWLFFNWAWIACLSAAFYYLPEVNTYLAIFAPFFVRGLLLTFFEKTIKASYTGQLVPPLFIGCFVFFIPIAALPVVGVYLAYEAYSLLKQFLHLSKLRGIDWPGTGSRKLIWLTFFFLTMAVMAGVSLWQAVSPGTAPQLLFILAAFVLSSQSAWYFSGQEAHEPLKSAQKYSGSSLDQPEKYRILNALDHQLVAKKYALDPNASLAGLAKKVFASPHQLSQVINENKGMSFFDLMAYHRVLEAKKLLRQHENRMLKIEEVGEKVGYMSKSSFNTVFKKFTGVTPSAYRDGGVRDRDLERRQRENIRPGHVEQGTFGALQTTGIMLNNFIKVYFRNLARKKAFTFITLSGLVVGMASAILIYVYINHELAYDKFHERSEDIYRIAFMSANPQTRTPHPMAQEMVREFPEVEAAVSLTPLYGPGLTKQSIYIRNPEKDVMFREPDGYAADSTFFQVFDFELLVGNKEEALKDIGGMIISESMAKKYFGDENPLGKMLEVNTAGHPVVVTGIMNDAPATSHFHPNFIVSYVTMKYMNPTDVWFTWADFGHFNYVKLRPGTDALTLQNRLPMWVYNQGHISEQWYNAFESGEVRFELQPITDIHLRSHIRWELEPNSSIVYVYILLAAIGFILTISSINFINLSTARALERAKEVGVRRTLGTHKSSISLQFLSESLFTCLLAFVLAWLLSLGLFDAFKSLTGKAFTYGDLLAAPLLYLGLAATVVVGIAAGLYPAFTVSQVKAGEILKGKFATGNKSGWVRKMLVVIQFTVSAILIFGSTILVSQVRYMESRPLGYSDEQVLVVDLKTEMTGRSLEALKTEIAKIPGVVDAGTLSNLPGTQFNQNGLFQPSAPDLIVDVSEIRMDYDAQRPLDLELVTGRWFDQSNALDSLGRSYVINETAARNLGLAEPLGAKLVWDDDDAPLEGTVVGVVKDFHFQSLHVPIQPLIMIVDYSELNYLLVRLDEAASRQTVEQIGAVYTSFDDKFEFEAFFLDQKNQRLYTAERQALKVFNLFSAIALLLAAMGLVGLAYLLMVQRTKEMGVRKILGATVGGLLLQENISFLKLVGVAVAVGLPLGLLLMTEWLAGFAYRVPVGVLPYIVTVVIIVAIASASVTLAVLRTVLVNPSKALRYE